MAALVAEAEAAVEGMADRRLGTALAVAGAAGAGLAWALAEAHWYALRQATVPVLPPGSAPLRVLHLSDLHLTPRQDGKIEWLRGLAALEPDLVIDTGDNFADPDGLPALLFALEPLLELPGAFVMGSNDYYAPKPKNPLRYLTPDARHPERELVRQPAEELVAAFTAAGWADLDNRRDTVTAGGRSIALVGVDDPHIGRDAFPGPDQAASGADLRLGVTHAPYRRVLDAMAGDGCDLILAGHTHGGQLCLPGVGALVTNCDLDRGRAKGLHGWPGPRPDEGGTDSTWLHVSAGLGTSPYAPVRFACRPEVTLLTLVPA